MGAVDLRSFSGPGPLAEAAGADWLREIAGLRSRQSKISVALAGGRIARQFCSAVASRATDPGSLEGVHFFWSDERCVPPGDPESNFRLANEALLTPMAIPAEQIHRIRGEWAPADAASRAESELRAILSCLPAKLPEIDFVFLGMGEDGHTASLFPGESEEEISSPALFRYVK